MGVSETQLITAPPLFLLFRLRPPLFGILLL
jgi:hypothetical protein